VTVWTSRQRDVRGSGRGRRSGTVDESRGDDSACRIDDPAGSRGDWTDESPGSCHDGRNRKAVRSSDDETPRGSSPSRPTTTDARVRVAAPLAEPMPGPTGVRRRTSPGNRRGLRVATRTGRRLSAGFRNEVRSFWRRNASDKRRNRLVTPVGRGPLAGPIHQPVRASTNPAGQRQEGLAHREARPASWEGKPLKGETPEALPTRNKVGRASGGATRQEAEKVCRRCTAG